MAWTTIVLRFFVVALAAAMPPGAISSCEDEIMQKMENLVDKNGGDLEKLFSTYGGSDLCVDRNGVKRILKDGDVSWSCQWAGQVLKKLDLNGDGCVSQSEFEEVGERQKLQQHPEVQQHPEEQQPSSPPTHQPVPPNPTCPKELPPFFEPRTPKRKASNVLDMPDDVLDMSDEDLEAERREFFEQRRRRRRTPEQKEAQSKIVQQDVMENLQVLTQALNNENKMDGIKKNVEPTTSKDFSNSIAARIAQAVRQTGGIEGINMNGAISQMWHNYQHPPTKKPTNLNERRNMLTRKKRHRYRSQAQMDSTFKLMGDMAGSDELGELGELLNPKTSHSNPTKQTRHKVNVGSDEKGQYRESLRKEKEESRERQRSQQGSEVGDDIRLAHERLKQKQSEKEEESQEQQRSQQVGDDARLAHERLKQKFQSEKDKESREQQKIENPHMALRARLLKMGEERLRRYEGD